MEKIVTHHWAKPIPDRNFDWSASYDNDEPDDNGNMSVGHGRTEAEAVLDLIDNDYRGIECERDERRCHVCGALLTIADTIPCAAGPFCAVVAP